MTNDKLKPCPFCGGKAEINTNENRSMLHVACSLCLVRTDDYYSEYRDYAIQDWNRRNPPDNTISNEWRTALSKPLLSIREVIALIEP